MLSLTKKWHFRMMGIDPGIGYQVSFGGGLVALSSTKNARDAAAEIAQAAPEWNGLRAWPFSRLSGFESEADGDAAGDRA